MSHRSANGAKLAKCDSQQWRTSSLEACVKLAGEEAKDRLYEPKHKKKVVRALTVVAYVFFVSLAAIMLSLYYVFLWKGGEGAAAKYVPGQRAARGRCDAGGAAVAERQKQLPPPDEIDDLTSDPPPTSFVVEPVPTSTDATFDMLDDDISLTYDDTMPGQELQSLGFIKRLMKIRNVFGEND